MLILFLTAFFVMAGFSLLLPSIVFVLQNLGASPALATPMLAAYSLAQFLFGPLWGGLSDRLGRKPVLLLCLGGSFGAYLFMSRVAADSLPLMLLALAMAGAMAGSLAVLFAAAADRTGVENRARGMGLIGAAIGLAFVFGPALGGYLAGESADEASIIVPAFASAAVSGLALMLVLVNFRESHSHAGTGLPVGRLKGLAIMTSRPLLARLGLMVLLFTVSLSLMEPSLPLLLEGRLGWGPRELGRLFTYVGLIMALMQGGVVPRIARRMGERPVARAGALMMGLGLAGLALADGLASVLAAMTLVGLGVACFNPTMASLASHQAGSGERGLVMGQFNAMQALGRSAGPLASGVLFQSADAMPFLVGAVLVLLVLVWQSVLFARLARKAAT